MVNNIEAAWIVEHDHAEANVLCIKVPVQSPVNVQDTVFENRGHRTINLGLLSDDALLKIRDCINKHLREL
jgi:hypothetical protein